MSKLARLQTQIDFKTKNDLEVAFEEDGLSLNDGIRLLLTQYAKGNIGINLRVDRKEASKRTLKREEIALKNKKNSTKIRDVDELDSI